MRDVTSCESTEAVDAGAVWCEQSIDGRSERKETSLYRQGDVKKLKASRKEVGGSARHLTQKYRTVAQQYHEKWSGKKAEECTKVK